MIFLILDIKRKGFLVGRRVGRKCFEGMGRVDRVYEYRGGGMLGMERFN